MTGSRTEVDAARQSGDDCCHYSGVARHGSEHGRTGHQSARRPEVKPQEWKTRRDLLEQFEASLDKGREVLRQTTDDRLLKTNWRMLAAGKLMSDQPRYVAIRDGVLNHMAHHRGQLTVYLRMNDEKVPAIYGPSADEGKD